MADAEKPKAKPKPKIDDEAQFERFVENALALGVEDIGPAFDEALSKIVLPKKQSPQCPE